MSIRIPESWDSEADFVVVGSGIGGLTAAITAREEGLNTIILEKASKIGGVTSFSFGEVWVANNHLEEKEVGVKDSPDEAEQYVRYMAPKEPAHGLLRAFIRIAPEVAKFLEEKAGVRWQVIKNFSDYLYPKAPGSKPQGRYLEPMPIKKDELGEWSDKILSSPHQAIGITHNEMFAMGGLGGFRNWDFELLGKRTEEGYLTFGMGLIAHLLKAITKRGMPIHTETPVREILIEEGKIVGVQAEKGGKAFFVRARKGVLLAVGAYDWNWELSKYYEFSPEWSSACPPTVEGDNIILTGRLGAMVAGVAVMGPVPTSVLGYHIPGEEQEEGKPLYRLLLEAGLPGVIIVNKRGERFCNEAFFYDLISKMANYDVLARGYSNWPCYLIFDQANREKYPLGPVQPGQDLPEGMGAKSLNLRELAEKLGIDSDGLERTVLKFNRHAHQGEDPEFHRGELPWQNYMAGDIGHEPNPNLGPLEKPPYYGIKIGVAASGIPTFGLKINENAQVIDVRGKAILALYAAGNSVAYIDTGGAYQSGFACCRGMVYGYIAARHAAGTWRGGK